MRCLRFTESLKQDEMPDSMKIVPQKDGKLNMKFSFSTHYLKITKTQAKRIGEYLLEASK